ncbi:hypothetical protein D3C72_2036860 [compost metagenome]
MTRSSLARRRKKMAAGSRYSARMLRKPSSPYPDNAASRSLWGSPKPSTTSCVTMPWVCSSRSSSRNLLGPIPTIGLFSNMRTDACHSCSRMPKDVSRSAAVEKP